MNDDGTMARMPDLERFAKSTGCASSRSPTSSSTACRPSARGSVGRGDAPPDLPGVWAAFSAHVYETRRRAAEFLALTLGDVGAAPSRCSARALRLLPGDLFSSTPFDGGAHCARPCRRSSRRARRLVYSSRRGAHDARGELKAHVLHDEPAARRRRREHSCASSASARRCSPTSACADLRLLTNSPHKIAGLDGFGLKVVERVPLEMAATRHNVA